MQNLSHSPLNEAPGFAIWAMFDVCLSFEDFLQTNLPQLLTQKDLNILQSDPSATPNRTSVNINDSVKQIKVQRQLRHEFN